VTIEIDLAGQVALVTGGARGVGRGITDRLLAAGATVAVCGRNEPEPGTLPDGVLFVAADVREPESVAALVGRVVGELGALHLAVNNAGGSPGTDAATASPRFSDKVLGLNLTAALHVSQAANAVIAEVGSLGGDGGVIVVTPRGEAVFAQNTPGMYRARATSAGVRQVAIFRQD